MTDTEASIAKLAEFMQKQSEIMEEARKDNVRREERIQALLETALQKPDPGNANMKIPSNATPAPTLLHNASLREFATWKQKFNDYSLLTGIAKANNNQQKAVLRSLLDDEWFRITKFALNIKMEEEATTVETIINEMQKHLRSQRNVVLDRIDIYVMGKK